MSELNDSSELQTYSSAVLLVLSAITPPTEYIDIIADYFITAIRSTSVRHLVLIPCDSLLNLTHSLGASGSTPCRRWWYSTTAI